MIKLRRCCLTAYHKSIEKIAVYTLSFFFFQAEDGIRDPLVTGVQTCALPISPTRRHTWTGVRFDETYHPVQVWRRVGGGDDPPVASGFNYGGVAPAATYAVRVEIGRASCRERV